MKFQSGVGVQSDPGKMDFNLSLAACFSSANRTNPYVECPFKPAVVVLMILGLSALSLITIIGNVLVIVSIKVNKSLQTVNNCFLFSLACADLIIGVFSMNLYTIYIVNGFWPLGPVICDLWLALDYVASNASVMNLLIISFDRYFCVTKPLSYPVKRTTRRAGMMIAAAWILSFVLWAPAILFWQFIMGNRTVPRGKCEIQFFSNAVVTFGTAIAAFYLPVVIMSVLYWQISKASRSRVRRRDFHKTSGVSQEDRTQATVLATQENRERKESEEADGSQTRHTGSSNIIGEDRESENDSTSGSILASSNQNEDAATNGDVKSTPTKRVRTSHAKLTCLGISPQETTSNSANQTTSHRKERQSLVALIFMPPHKKKRRNGCSRERKVTRTIMAILLAFVITWTPYNVMVLINTFCSDCIPNSMWALGYWLCYINSTV
ncbi:Muscarinic acetylcholine receptor M2 [Bagarius yarrelli]|uniref:Muscarinic acetylcholine receptor n=1 Tax=Bagarius yarrelli TaxID=175774 RepID=A0A556TNG1_BAGYA|nr:Muscarinic acetylcholine receptor M2 [Bagarius yarrelli]